ncbi:bidirectional sugar transporter SWEET4-like [Syzygium oleosum]|uniref:bidirectional sugar transporter SWEET4-like n=1 Tax=Syzygium oleosum TaxID=219896 RepID=UPI0024BB17B8|nr:bidirectional sugar transporter SWEET4-like [Syzygium oleosum]
MSSGSMPSSEEKLRSYRRTEAMRPVRLASWRPRCGRLDGRSSVLSITKVFISVGLLCNPMFYRIIKNKSVGEFHMYPYLATVLNCVFWLLYGLPFVHPNSILVVTSYPVGLAIELIYICIFFSYAPNKGRKKVVYCLCGEVVFIAVVSLVFLLVFQDHKRRILAFGIICDVFNIIMYSSPLTIMKKVITTKSVEYMPFYLSLANFLNGCVWTAYALIKLDVFILISNGLGALSGAAQLILYGCYFRSMPPRDEKVVDAKASQIQLSVSNGPDRV